jgi:hypothetical protein
MKSDFRSPWDAARIDRRKKARPDPHKAVAGAIKLSLTINVLPKVSSPYNCNYFHFFSVHF